MLSKLRPRSAYDVMAALGLFLALGGTAYAVAANSVGTAQLKNGAVTNPKLAKDSVGSGKVIDGSLLANDFKAGALGSAAAHYVTFDHKTGSKTKTILTKGPFTMDATCFFSNPTQLGVFVNVSSAVKISGTTYTEAEGPYGWGRAADTTTESMHVLQPAWSGFHDPNTFYWYGGIPVSFISDKVSLDGILSFGTGGYHTCEVSFFGG